MTPATDSIAPLREFIAAMTRLIDTDAAEEPMVREGRRLLAKLVSRDDWLPKAFAQAGNDTYRQYLLYCDPLERFSVVSFVWGPGQRTPVHDHTVWGLVGILRGQEHCAEYEQRADGQVVSREREHLLKTGMVEAVSPRLGDWHVVANALTDRPSISIHVYGGNIGRVHRHRVDPASGRLLDFVSGYSNDTVPSLWPA